MFERPLGMNAKKTPYQPRPRGSRSLRRQPMTIDESQALAAFESDGQISRLPTPEREEADGLWSGVARRSTARDDG